jgi:hypothetical protein
MRARKKKPTPAQNIFGEEGKVPSMCWFTKPRRLHKIAQIMQEAKASIDTTKASVCILDNRLGYLSGGVNSTRNYQQVIEHHL